MTPHRQKLNRVRWIVLKINLTKHNYHNNKKFKHNVKGLQDEEPSPEASRVVADLRVSRRHLVRRREGQQLQRLRGKRLAKNQEARIQLHPGLKQSHS